MIERYSVSRVMGSQLVRVGTLQRTGRETERFSYAESYVERREAPLSLSLSLRLQDYAAQDIRPYFDGLLPEEPTRDAIVARLQVAQTDWLAILGSSGLDCVGDVVLEPEDPEVPDVQPWDRGDYESLSNEDVRALEFGKPVACIQRFDRDVAKDGVNLRVERLHQEDLAQAFGVPSQSKYVELEGGTYAAIARLLRQRSSDPLTDIDQLARIAVFDYLVGNCDNHLKNLSVFMGRRRCGWHRHTTSCARRCLKGFLGTWAGDWGIRARLTTYVRMTSPCFAGTWDWGRDGCGEFAPS